MGLQFGGFLLVGLVANSVSSDTFMGIFIYMCIHVHVHTHACTRTHMYTNHTH